MLELGAAAAETVKSSETAEGSVRVMRTVVGAYVGSADVLRVSIR